MKCHACKDREYVVSERLGEGRLAVQRCDACCGRGMTDEMTDEDAAVLAHRDGFLCDPTYPCYIPGKVAVYPDGEMVRVTDSAKTMVPEDVVEAIRPKRSCGTCENFHSSSLYGEPLAGQCGINHVTWDHWVCPRWSGTDSNHGKD